MSPAHGRPKADSLPPGGRARSAKGAPTPPRDCPNDDPVIARTQAWVEEVVIGLELCPFARTVQARGQVRYVHSQATDADGLLQALSEELHLLTAADPASLETTLLIHPRAMVDFLDYNEFLDAADGAVAALGYEGVLQVASFHPDYQFEGTRPDDVTNATNRSPYPTLHLLREASVDRAVQAFGDTGQIYRNNVRTLQALGQEGWARLQAGFAMPAALPAARPDTRPARRVTTR